MRAASSRGAILLSLAEVVASSGACVESGPGDADAGPPVADAPDVAAAHGGEDGPDVAPFLDADPAPDANQDAPVAAPTDASPDRGPCGCRDFFTGCGAGRECSLVLTGVENGKCLGCRPAQGTGMQGDPCKNPLVDGDEGCAPGFLCGFGDRCMRGCDPAAADPKCPPEGGQNAVCGPNRTFGIHVCQTAACDPLAQTGCMAGEACYAEYTPVGGWSLCRPAGSLPAGADCPNMPANVCEKGSSCQYLVSPEVSRPVCRRHCDRMGGAPACPGGAACEPASLGEFGPRLGFCR